MVDKFIKLLLSILSYSNIYIVGPNISSGQLLAGYYKIEIAGAKGGQVTQYSQVYADGGHSSYASAEFNVIDKIDYNITVGEKSLYNAGQGVSSNNWKTGYGGGSSFASLGGNLIVAAGGSGAADHISGSPGGGENYNYIYDTSSRKHVKNTNPAYYREDSYGENGYSEVDNGSPGSGGAGGYKGGIGGRPNSFALVGSSGTSYITPGNFFVNKIILDGLEAASKQNSFVNLTIIYLCASNCKNCNSSDYCLECRDPTYIIDNGQCVPSQTPSITPLETPFPTSVETPYSTPFTTVGETAVQTPDITPAETSEPSEPSESDSSSFSPDEPGHITEAPTPHHRIEQTYRYEDIKYFRSKFLNANGRLRGY